MTRGAKGCLLAAGVMLVVVIVVAAAVMLAGGLGRNSVLQVTLAGEIAEDADDSLVSTLLGVKPTLLRDVTRAIERAGKDDRITGLMVTLKPYEMGLAKVQEIRDAVKAFRGSGKWACVYMDTAGEFSGGNSIYYLSTAFDEIWLSPGGDLNLFGLFGSVTFLRGTLDKLGVYPDYDSIGKYKNAKDIYTERKMTEAHREATMAYLKDWYDQIAAGIADGRGLEPARVDALINEGPFTGDEALAHGLVDKLAYFDEFQDAVAKRNGQSGAEELTSIGYKDYLEKRGRSGGRHRIAVVTGMGVVVTGRSQNDPSVGAMMGSDTVTEALRTARRDEGIKAIILRVDSPGGSAVASDLIWRETQLARKQKPVIISMSDVAASGGYYVSAGATKIVTQPATITGSIGVVAGKLVTTGLYDWAGLARDTVQIGDHASFYYTGSRYSVEEKELYWKFMNKIYDKFTGLVAEGRGMTKERVNELGQGRVWSGARARELGLVDELGGLSKAIELARTEAGIPEDQEVRLVYLPEKRSFLQSLLFPDETTSARSLLPPGVRRSLQDVARLELLSRERVFLLSEPPADLSH